MFSLNSPFSQFTFLQYKHALVILYKLCELLQKFKALTLSVFTEKESFVKKRVYKLWGLCYISFYHLAAHLMLHGKINLSYLFTNHDLSKFFQVSFIVSKFLFKYFLGQYCFYSSMFSIKYVFNQVCFQSAMFSIRYGVCLRSARGREVVFYYGTIEYGDLRSE